MAKKNMINVEGGEVVQYDGKAPVKISGPSHENGGVDIPDENANIYSKRVFFDGNSMAERKKQRMLEEDALIKKIKKFQKSIQNDPTNIPVKNTLDRTIRGLMILKSKNAVEDASDMAIMEHVKTNDTSKEFGGGGRNSIDPVKSKRRYQTAIDLTNDSNDIKLNESTNFSGAAPKQESIQPLPRIQSGVQSTFKQPTLPAADIPESNSIGKAGTYIKALSPTLFSFIDALTTERNVNAFQNVGDSATSTLDSAIRELNISNKLAEQDIDKDIKSAMIANRPSTRSLSVLRALNLATGLRGDEAVNKVRSENARTTAQLLSDKSKINFESSIREAEGAQAKQIADQSDISAIISNFSSSGQAVGSGLEHIQKMINSDSYNEDFLDILNSLSPNVRVVKDPVTGRLSVVPK